MLLYERPYLRIYVYDLHRLILTEWTGFALSEELREGLEEALRLAQQYGVTLWIADYENRRIIAPNDQQWIIQKWLPRLSALGIERLAIVESANIFNKMSVNTIMREASGSVTWDTRYFKDRKEAEKWVIDGF